MKRSKISQAMMDRWEKSKEDEKKDKREAKKRGMSRKEWEGSKADERMDKAAMRKKMKK